MPNPINISKIQYIDKRQNSIPEINYLAKTVCLGPT